MFSSDYTKWSDKIKEDTDLFSEMYASFPASDVDDWEGKAWGIFSRIGLEKPSGLLFDGPVGSGKHTAVASFIKVAKASENDVHIFTPKNMPRTPEDYETFESHLNTLLDESGDNGKPCVLVFDSVEKYKCTEDLLEYLTYFVSMYRQYIDALAGLFVILISNEELQIPAILSQNFYSFHMGNTSYDQRVRYLKNNASKITATIEPETLAAMTGNVTYGQLATIVKNIEMKLLSSELVAFGEEQISEFVSSQVKTKATDDSMSRIADNLGVLIEKLPEALAGVGTRVVEKETNSQPVSQAPSINENPGEYSESRRKEFTEMPPMELAIELYGEETANIILRLGQQNKAALQQA